MLGIANQVVSSHGSLLCRLNDYPMDIVRLSRSQQPRIFLCAVQPTFAVAALDTTPEVEGASRQATDQSQPRLDIKRKMKRKLPFLVTYVAIGCRLFFSLVRCRLTSQA
jgi:hypothetical protein